MTFRLQVRLLKSPDSSCTYLLGAGTKINISPLILVKYKGKSEKDNKTSVLPTLTWHNAYKALRDFFPQIKQFLSCFVSFCSSVSLLNLPPGERNELVYRNVKFRASAVLRFPVASLEGEKVSSVLTAMCHPFSLTVGAIPGSDGNVQVNQTACHVCCHHCRNVSDGQLERPLHTALWHL